MLQGVVGGWHRHVFPDADVFAVLAKLLEEAGELARAAIGHVQGRPDRGDVGLEAAQTVLVVLALCDRFFPGVDVLQGVHDEIERKTRTI